MKIAKASYAKSAKFDHKAHADRLDELNTQAQAARRVDVALGLYCYELKEIHLQHGMFGKWLAEHRPHLARKHAEGSWQASNSLDAAMWMAKSALEVCGYQIGDYIKLVQNQIPVMAGICDSAQLMLLPAAELPKEFKKLRDEIFDLVDGKSQRQLRAEFKQIEEGQVKVGRLKGAGGKRALSEPEKLANRQQRANLTVEAAGRELEALGTDVIYAAPAAQLRLAAVCEVMVRAVADWQRHHSPERVFAIVHTGGPTV